MTSTTPFRRSKTPSMPQKHPPASTAVCVPFIMAAVSLGGAGISAEALAAPRSSVAAMDSRNAIVGRNVWFLMRRKYRESVTELSRGCTQWITPILRKSRRRRRCGRSSLSGAGAARQEMGARPAQGVGDRGSAGRAARGQDTEYFPRHEGRGRRLRHAAIHRGNSPRAPPSVR